MEREEGGPSPEKAQQRLEAVVLSVQNAARIIGQEELKSAPSNNRFWEIFWQRLRIPGDKLEEFQKSYCQSVFDSWRLLLDKPEQTSQFCQFFNVKPQQVAGSEDILRLLTGQLTQAQEEAKRAGARRKRGKREEKKKEKKERVEKATLPEEYKRDIEYRWSNWWSLQLRVDNEQEQYNLRRAAFIFGLKTLIGDYERGESEANLEMVVERLIYETCVAPKNGLKIISDPKDWDDCIWVKDVPLSQIQQGVRKRMFLAIVGAQPTEVKSKKKQIEARNKIVQRFTHQDRVSGSERLKGYKEYLTPISQFFSTMAGEAVG